MLAALNLLLATRVADGRPSSAIVLALLPALLIAAGALVASSRAILVFIALGIGIIGGPLNEALPLSGSIKVYPTDVVLCLAVGAWAAAWLTSPPDKRPRWPSTPVLGWPLLLLGIGVMQGLIRGNDRYGTSVLSGPVRLILYAAIATAIADLRPATAFKGLVAVFYAGTLWHVLGGIGRLAAGTPISSELSTGGFRFVALSVGMFLGGSLILSLLCLDLERQAGRRVLHLAMAGLAAFGILATFGRTNYMVVGVLAALVLLRGRNARAATVGFLPLAVPVLIIVVLLLPRAAPEFGQTLEARLAGDAKADTSVSWRKESFAAIWKQVEESPLNGVGFGPGAVFFIDGVRWEVGQDPHNGYLYLWAGGGLLALGGFILLLVVFMCDALRRLRDAEGVDRALILWSVSMCLILALNFLTTPFFTVPRVDLTLWIALLLPATVVRRASPATDAPLSSTREDRRPASSSPRG